MLADAALLPARRGVVAAAGAPYGDRTGGPAMKRMLVFGAMVVALAGCGAEPEPEQPA